MKYRRLGNSDLQVSEIGLGSWLTYSGGVERAAAERCVARAFELGINFIDTANVYGRGAAETFLGQVLPSRPRDSYVLATKLFFPMSDTDRGLSAAQVTKQLDASLARLRADHVDLYQCHRYDSGTPLAETMRALTDAVRAGKCRYIGFSEWTAAQVRAATEMAGVEKFVSSQPQYSMLWRVPEAEVIPYCRDHGISQVVWSPLAQGILTGKYLPGQPPPADSRAAHPAMNSFMGPDRRSIRTLTAVQNLKPIAHGLGLTMAQLALAWVLREPNVASAITSASRPEQLDDTTRAAGVALDDATLRAIEAVLAPVIDHA